MTQITTAAALQALQARGVEERAPFVDAALSQDEKTWLAEALEVNLRDAHALAYHKNESMMQLQFSEDGLKKHLKYARQPRGEVVRSGHALNGCTRELLRLLYEAGYSVYQEYQDGQLPGTLWSWRGPQRLMLRWA